ncbi:ABC transporter substrate-binding protein [Salinispirillum sp. LH 10-3-1]|uniref:ABC transporter substrate-binding protein n=1 Tax=Salinispirillum sp. LH 10-3-1 TaxID=2952525 RepID=A0AB38YKP7_9GAMM
MSSTESPLKLGFMPLLDAAPLIVAQELGLYKAEGLNVSLVRESSWATIRDKVAFGILDGAHMLAPIPFASTLGLGSVRKPMLTALSLGLNGNAMTVSKALSSDLTQQSSALPQPTTPAEWAQRLSALTRDSATRARPLTLAIVHPHSMHHFLLRTWLKSGGVNPEQDLNIVVVPPPMMVSALEQGDIDGFCVGEPYNAIAQRKGLGDILLTGHDIWPNAPEKVFGVTQQWATAHEEMHHQLIRALIRACQWLDRPENRNDISGMLCQPDYLGLDRDVLQAAVQQMSAPQGTALPATHKHFFQHDATVPWPAHGHWITQQLQELSAAALDLPPTLVADVYRTDLYRRAAESLNIPCPT